MARIDIPLVNLQRAHQSDFVGMLALRREFGDEIVDQMQDVLPHLDSTLAIAAHKAHMEADQYATWLRRFIDEHADDPEEIVAAIDYIDTVASKLIRIIDPTFETEDRRRLTELLSIQLAQILEDSKLTSA